MTKNNEVVTAVLVEASKLSLSDRFMQHNPMTKEEQLLKDTLTEVICSGIKDFWRPECDPAFNEDKTGILYEAGNKPAVGQSYDWWKKTAEEFLPERKSRLGTKSEYVAFLGVLIKKLVESGWYTGQAWGAVCNDSIKIGSYFNADFKDSKYEATGSHRVCDFFDLANTAKILADDTAADVFWVVSGGYYSASHYHPLANMRQKTDKTYNWGSSVGWIVCDFS